MTTKNGNLNDGREVFFNGKKIEDLTTEVIFSKTLKVIQRYYKLRETDPSMSFEDENGESISKLFITPRSTEDLIEKRKVYEKIARESCGMLGRTPDFIDTGVAILPEYASVLGSDKKANYFENALNWAKTIRHDDLFVSHAIQNPQLDRSKGLQQLLDQGEEFAGVWIKEQREDGVVVRGAKQVNTLAPFADQLLVFNLPGLHPEDSKFALAFWLPLNAKGVKTVCRKPTFRGDDLRDHPLANAFDELDAFIIFDDVFIPNENLFVCGNVDLSNAFFAGSGIFVHTAHQDEVRGSVKLEFATALAVKLAEKLGLTGFTRVQEILGNLTINLEMIRASVVASESTGHMEGDVYTPNMQILLAVRSTLTKYYDEVLSVIAEFSSGSAVGVPDFKQFEIPEIADILKSSLTSPLMLAEERALLLNLAWDVANESFGQRQRTYELLHGGNPMFIKIQHWQNEDLSAGNDMINRILGDAAKSKAK
ncbi:4-hydroxyphenylacetate 3-hydroxylase N-terminal domain-containing protein [Lactovum miscens]|uniref:4-hydroxyphenylacetate 3-monooxygenase n=1 Tax=Lactovum miscens TaxID=190387 RepID=A0A841C705_9LACT|nr:4-hydroxyphenylacetate 3-hydroxylase N-terminal domain-containing protein [Lactovum miscens]MBB5887331.1 4-hydroxyphenylacetate 3-monooxygenase [Lactovum miscens]